MAAAGRKAWKRHFGCDAQIEASWAADCAKSRCEETYTNTSLPARAALRLRIARMDSLSTGGISSTVNGRGQPLGAGTASRKLHRDARAAASQSLPSPLPEP